MADLNKVIADFKQMIGKLKGGDKYQAWLLTPCRHLALLHSTVTRSLIFL